MLWAGVVLLEDGMMDDCSSHAGIVAQIPTSRDLRGAGVAFNIRPRLTACVTVGVRIPPELSMANNRGPTKRSRFEVPLSKGKPSGRASKDRRSAHPPYQQGAGTSPALINAGIVVVATLITTLLLLGISGQIRDTTAANLIAPSPPPMNIGGAFTMQPTPQPSLTIATPSPQSSRAVASPSIDTAAAVATPDDTEVQSAIDNKLGDDGSLSQLGITATVNDGKVVLVGTAPSVEMKDKVEKLVRGVKGVRQIDNQIVVINQ
jgi:hypothetical protein